MQKNRFIILFIVILLSVQCTRQTAVKSSLNKISILYITNWNLDQSPKIATLIKNEKKINPVLVLINSQIFTQLSDSIQRLLAINVLNSSQVDAALLTPDFLYWGIDQCQEIIKKANFYCLAANLKDAATNSFLGQEYLIKQFDKLNMGVIGIIYDSLNPIYKFINLEFRNPEFSALKLIPLVKNRSNILCLLTYTNDSLDFPVDIVLGAPSKNSFTILPEPAHSINKIEIGLDNSLNMVELKRFTMSLDNLEDDSIIMNLINQYQTNTKKNK